VGGGGPLDPTSQAQPKPPKREVLQALPGVPLSVAGVDAVKTVVCNEGMVNVSGVSSEITITGHCVSVNVSGVENRVTLENADTITASGFNNRVTYRAGDPQINNSGGDNVVERG
jgi:Protein of unknown function (DUF3060)